MDGKVLGLIVAGVLAVLLYAGAMLNAGAAGGGDGHGHGHGGGHH